jgi:light-harvesting complex 1 alpha chain
MHKMFMVFDPRQAFVALVTFLAILAFGIHALLLSTERYNWLENPGSGQGSAAKQMSALPPSY